MQEYAKVKYKVKAGLQNSVRGIKIFGKTKLVLDRKSPQERPDSASLVYDKEVSGCWFSRGKYRFTAFFRPDQCIVGNAVVLKLAVDASQANHDINNLACEFVMVTQATAHDNVTTSRKVISRVDLGKVKATTKSNSFEVTIQTETLPDLQATTKGHLVVNRFLLMLTAKVDGCCDNGPFFEFEVDVFNKCIDRPPLRGVIGTHLWSPKTFHPYVVQLSCDQFKMDHNFKKHYKPMKNVEHFVSH